MDENETLKVFRNLFPKSEDVTREEFASVIGPLVGGERCANQIFTSLDQNGDGVLHLEDLLPELQNFLQENRLNEDGTLLVDDGVVDRRRRSDTQLAWSQIVEGIGEPVVKKFLNNRSVAFVLDKSNAEREKFQVSGETF